MNIDVFIPLANCQTVSTEVLDSISDQRDVRYTLIHPTRDYYPKGNKKRFQAIAENRSNIIGMGMLLKSDYLVMSNSDRVLPRGCIDSMKTYLSIHPEHGAVSFYHEDMRLTTRNHTRIDTLMLRKEVLYCVRFNFIAGCDCKSLQKDLENNGYKIGYINHGR